jgi:predicted metal-dependent peptidase
MSDAERDAAQPQLAAARARLILDQPFIGVLLLHLPFQAAGWCETVATDARRIYYNPDYIRDLDARQIQFVLAHQALHCALGHFARRGHRLHGPWDAACDYAVNLLLIEEGLPPVPGALIDSRFRALSAEEIYPLLAADRPGRTLDAHLFDATASHGAAVARHGLDDTAAEESDGGAAESTGTALDSDAAPQSRRHRPVHSRRHLEARGEAAVAVPLPPDDDLARRWQTRCALAAQQARHAGRLSSALQRLLAAVLEPPLPWRALLARFLATRAQEDYTFQRPQRRESDIFLPRLRSESIEIHAVLDTSGSIGDAELSAFAAEIDALKGQVRARVTVHACDRALAPAGPWTFEPWQPIVLPDRLSGGGGTDFRPVFEWLQAGSANPDAVVYFTDACGDFPAHPPAYPVLWLVKGNAEVPWGERIAFS